MNVNIDNAAYHIMPCMINVELFLPLYPRLYTNTFKLQLATGINNIYVATR